MADQSAFQQPVRNCHLSPGNIFQFSSCFLFGPLVMSENVLQFERGFEFAKFPSDINFSLNSTVFGEHIWYDFCSLNFTEAAGCSPCSCEGRPFGCC